jgi:hypothetical protein
MTFLTLSRVCGGGEVQSLGGMVGPITCRLPDDGAASPMQVAPMADEAGEEDLPGILSLMRGEWPGLSITASPWSF